MTWMFIAVKISRLALPQWTSAPKPCVDLRDSTKSVDILIPILVMYFIPLYNNMRVS